MEANLQQQLTDDEKAILRGYLPDDALRVFAVAARMLSFSDGRLCGNLSPSDRPGG